MFDRLEDTVNRYEDITAELGNPDVVNDQEKFRKLMKEQSSLAPVSYTHLDVYKRQEYRYVQKLFKSCLDFKTSWS